MSDQPFFRFYLNAYAEGGPFEASDVTCDVCSRPSVWLFSGVIYEEGDVERNVCARCIADGGLARLAPNYGLHDMEFAAKVGPALAQEVEQRTPGFATWNAFEWPVRGGMPLAFLGYGADENVRQSPEAIAAIGKLFARYSLESADPSHALVFKEIDGPNYSAVLDLD